MPAYCEAEVVELVMQRRGLQRVHVRRSGPDSQLTAENELAYVLTELVGEVAVGDLVVINTTAVDLDLGTGGAHVVHWNLSRRDLTTAGGGHVMKLRYTSCQHNTGVAEEHESNLAYVPLTGMPVVGCVLHSQLAAVAVAAKHLRPDVRVAYIMSDQASLPLALSDLVADLSDRKLVDVTITCGQAFGGELEAVTFESALQLAVQQGQADVIVVGDGPGVVGTGSNLGFSSLTVGHLLTASLHERAETYLALRWSAADTRRRHRGLSHHSVTLLQRTPAQIRLAIPSETEELETYGHDVCVVDVPDMVSLFADLGLDVRSMGRTAGEDPGFFRFAAAAGIAAVQALS